MASDLDGKFLYLFNRVIGPDTYILFKIDILKHLENYNKPSPTPSDNDDNNRYESLHQLLVFPEPVLPYHCVCAKMGSIFYFLCGMLWKNTFGFKDSKRTDVYKIRESDLSGIRPSELNLNGKDYLIKTASMNGDKHLPTVFVVQNKLYVLSHYYISDTQFEVYSPDSDSWRVLPPLPGGGWPWLSSYVVMERNQTVYFMINRCAFLSFNFEKEMWGTVMMPNNMNSLPVLPSFASPVVIMGDKGFGFLLDEEDPRLLSLTICAIPLPDNGGGEISYESLLPSIAPDDEFKHALDSSRCPAVTDKFLENFSESIVALDGGKIMCVVSYACGSVMGSYAECLDIYTSYATLTFFEHIGCEDIDRDKKVAGELVFNKYFKTKYLHNVQLIVKTTTLPTCSAIRACLFEDL